MKHDKAILTSAKADPIPRVFPETGSQTGRVLLDPTLDPTHLCPALDILPLVVDTVVIVQPSRENLATWNYNYQRFSDLVQGEVFLPFFPSGETNPFPKGIERADMIQDSEFFGLYEQSIQHDLEDDTFCSLAEDYGMKSVDLAFNINWDLIMSQLIGSPVISPPNLGPIWEHKLSSSIRDLSAVGTLPPEIENAHILRIFLERVLDDLPSTLTVDQLTRFRRHQGSRNFRLWLRTQLQTPPGSQAVDHDDGENVYAEFRKLARKYSASSNRITTSVTAFTSAAGAAIGAMLGNTPEAAATGAAIGGFLGPSSTHAFQSVLRRVWQDRQPRNWVFMLLDFRSELSL